MYKQRKGGSCFPVFLFDKAEDLLTVYEYTMHVLTCTNTSSLNFGTFPTNSIIFRKLFKLFHLLWLWYLENLWKHCTVIKIVYNAFVKLIVAPILYLIPSSLEWVSMVKDQKPWCHLYYFMALLILYISPLVLKSIYKLKQGLD